MKVGTILIIVFIIAFIMWMFTQYTIEEISCPSPDSQVMEQLSWINERLDEVVQQNDYFIDRTYCNSVWCWGSEEAYREWSKMDNNNPQKWIYTSEQERKNYFNPSKLH